MFLLESALMPYYIYIKLIKIFNVISKFTSFSSTLVYYLYFGRCELAFRSYKAVGGGAPVVMKEGHGAYLYDVDGNKYIDYLQAYGPIITCIHPHITETIQDQAAKGVLYGTPTELEINFSKT